MATLVAERFFDKYNEQTLADCMDVLDALGSTMLISKNLIFLGLLFLCSVIPASKSIRCCRPLEAFANFFVRHTLPKCGNIHS